MSSLLDDHSSATLVATFLDAINEVIAIGMKLRTRPTRGVDRVAEAQFRRSYEAQREELERWLTSHMDEAARASPYEIAACLTDTAQDGNLDPKTRNVLVALRKGFIEALPRVARPEMLSELAEGLRVIGESGAYAPSSLTALCAALAERIADWPPKARETVESVLQGAIPSRPSGRGRLPTQRRTTADDHRPPPNGAGPGPEALLPAPDGVASTEAVLTRLFGVGPAGGRLWAEMVAEMAGPPAPPSDPEALVTRMAALPPQGREIVCKRMRMTLPCWCAACGQGHLRALGRAPAVGETLANTCQRLETDAAFADELRAALPAVVRDSGSCTEAGLRALGPVVERLWEESLGEELSRALTHSAHPRPGALRRLLTQQAPRLAAALAAGAPVTDAPWRETLNRRGVPWPDRLALPPSRVPVEVLLSVWMREQEDDPNAATTLLDAAAAEAAMRPEAGELLVRLLEARPDTVGRHLAPLLAHLTARPDALDGRPGLTRAFWEAVLAQPAYLASLPEGLGTVLTPLLPPEVPPARQWAGALLRGPAWLRAALLERLHTRPPEQAPWLGALLAELEAGAIPGVPDDAAARVAHLLVEALGTD